MKKIYLLLVLLSFLSVPSFGGNKDSSRVKSYPCVSLNAGVGIPSFDNNGNNNQTNALVGPSINIYATLPIKHSCFGIAGVLSSGLNEFYLPSDEGAYNGVSISKLNAGNYYVIAIMPGIFITVLDNTVDFHLLGGLIDFITPEVIYSGTTGAISLTTPSVTGTWVKNSEASTSFGIDIGVSIKSKLTKKFYWMLNADILDIGMSINLTAGVGYSSGK